ncbi:MAG: DNA primase [Patescibacteria group bacterium]
MSSSVEKIKERLSITDVVSSYLKLEKAGASYKAKCPFHNEKTPSFFVSPDRGTYYCFGCGAKGDMFTFVEEFEGLEFRQALTNLATKAGVELVPERRGERDEKDKLFKAVETSVEFFESGLVNNKSVLDYLHKRGLTAETISKWRIGYAKNEWRTLYDHLLAEKISETDMLATGLIKRNDRSDTVAQHGVQRATQHTGPQSFYDVFRGRIMFPIFDSTGRPVAFSGRIFVDDDKSPKYLNSPATVLFNKSEVLYGFDRAKTAIRKLNYSILVEGQMDLILSHQAGLANTVASSGTALTEFHLRRLLRLSPRVMFAFDSDSAGFNATKRSAELAMRIGMEVKVAVLPPGEDPASLVAKNPNLWKQALKNGKHIIDFYADNLLARKLDPRVLSREIKSAVLPFVLHVESKTEQAHFIKSIAEKSGLKEDALWDDFKTLLKSPKTASGESGQNGQNERGGRPAGQSGQTEKTTGKILTSRRQGIERRIIGVILWQESRHDDKGNHGVTASAIRKRFVEIAGVENAQALEVAVADERDKLIFEAEQYYEQSAKFEKDIEGLFMNLEEEMLKDELAKKMVELHRAEIDKDGVKVEEFLNQCQQITSRLTALKEDNKLKEDKL